VCQHNIHGYIHGFIYGYPYPRPMASLNVQLYHTIDLYQPWKIAGGRADIALATGVYRPQRMRQRRTSLIGCCRQRATASPICKHRSRRPIVLPFSKFIFNIFQIILAYLFRRVRSYDKEFITRLFSYRHLYQALVDISPRLRLGQLSTLGLDIRADIKTALR